MTTLHFNYRPLYLACLLSGATTMATPGLAAEKSSGFTLEEVVVTARKKSESIQDIPVAVSAMSADDIASFDFKNAVDVAAQVPNMQVSGPFGKVQPLFSIRGVSMSDYNPNLTSPIGVYVDEASLGTSYLQGMSMFDLERIEVLRGPQGTLYGKSTTGGAINFISRTPQVGDELSGNIKLGAGKYSHKYAEGGIEGTVIEDKLAVRLAGNVERRDGLQENHFPGGKDTDSTDSQNYRLTMNWQVNDKLDAILKLTHGENDSIPSAPRGEGIFPPGGSGLTLSGPDGRAGLDHRDVNVDDTGAMNIEADIATLRLNYEADNFTVVSVTSAYDGDYALSVDTDGTPMRVLHVNWSSDTQAFSQDLRLITDFSDNMHFVGGLYYLSEEVSVENIFEDLRDGIAAPFLPVLGEPLYNALNQWGGIYQAMETKLETTAIYGQLNVELNEQFTMDIGLRYTQDDNTLEHINTSRVDSNNQIIGTYLPGNPIGADLPFIPCNAMPTGCDAQNTPFYPTGPATRASAPKQNVDEGNWSGKLGLNYNPSDDLLVYASFSRGYRTGAWNGGAYYTPRPVDTAFAAPEFVNAFELGAKSEILDNRVRLNGAVFFYDYKDMQFSNLVNVSAFLENADAEIKGIEVEMQTSPIEGMDVSAGLGWLDTEYTQLTLTGTNLKGNELIAAPKVNFNFSVGYDIPINDAMYLRPHIDGSYRDDQWFSAYNDKSGHGTIRQESYWLLNARLSLRATDNSWELSLWGKNITDEEHDVFAIDLKSFGFDHFRTGEQATWGLEANYRF